MKKARRHEGTKARRVGQPAFISLLGSTGGGSKTGAAVLRGALAMLLFGAFSSGCDEMVDNGRVKPLEPSTFFADGRSSRPLVEGTVARPAELGTGEMGTEWATTRPTDTYPVPVTRQVLERGRERYNIYCGVCHGEGGDGDGMIVRRGFTTPPSLHLDRLREAPDSHYYEVMTNGWGSMYSYADRITPEDRWRITAYVRALQYSQRAPEGDLSAEDRARVEASDKGDKVRK